MKPLAFGRIGSVQECGNTPLARSEGSNTGTSPTKVSKPSRLWLWFVAAFVVQFAAWTTWFVIAAHHHVEDVPLASGVRK